MGTNPLLRDFSRSTITLCTSCMPTHLSYIRASGSSDVDLLDDTSKVSSIHRFNNFKIHQVGKGSLLEYLGLIDEVKILYSFAVILRQG